MTFSLVDRDESIEIVSGGNEIERVGCLLFLDVAELSKDSKTIAFALFDPIPVRIVYIRITVYVSSFKLYIVSLLS